jgi:hypothetical protein
VLSLSHSLPDISAASQSHGAANHTFVTVSPARRGGCACRDSEEGNDEWIGDASGAGTPVGWECPAQEQRGWHRFGPRTRLPPRSS